MLFLVCEPSVLFADSYKSRYDQGRRYFVQGKYNSAIRHFRNMLETSRTNDLSDNCQYWIGEAYFNMKKYEQALIEFDRTLTFPNTNKREDAMYKVANCHEKLGEKKLAREMYLRLLADYPESRHTSYVLKVLEKLGTS